MYGVYVELSPCFACVYRLPHAAGATPNYDEFNVAANEQIYDVVGLNDDNLDAPGVTYSFAYVTVPQIYSPAGSLIAFAGGWTFNNTGGFWFNPKQQSLLAGSRVTWNYTISSSSGYKSAPGMVNVYVTDAVSAAGRRALRR